jgi:transposase InsO family protein
LGSKAKWEYFRVLYERYRNSQRQAKKVMLDEFCRNTSYHRKYAIRLLNGPPPGQQRDRPRRTRRVSYGHQVLSILAAVWEAAAYPWSVRLKALLPDWLPWIRKHFRPSAAVEQQLLRISARQIDRRLRAKKQAHRRRLYGRTKPGCLLKHQIPVKTDSWDITTPGFAEVDLVAHSGNSGAGEFAHSLNLTDVHSGWTESRAFLGRSELAVQRTLDEIRAGLPFRLLGLDSDNGSEFINWHLKHWCEEHHIQLTRGRPYKKDDNAHVEQKNWTHVRKLLGWERYDSPAAVAAINELYRQELRLWLNLFLPSVKLVKKVRVGSKVRRVYDAPQTPLQRVMASGQADAERVAELKKLRLSLDPFELGKRIDEKLQRIYQLANRRLSPKPGPANDSTRKSKTSQTRYGHEPIPKSKGKTNTGELRNRGWGKRASNAGPLPPDPLSRAHGYISNVSTG